MLDVYITNNMINIALINSMNGAGEEVKVVLAFPSRRPQGLSQESRRNTSMQPMSADTVDEGRRRECLR